VRFGYVLKKPKVLWRAAGGERDGVRGKRDLEKGKKLWGTPYKKNQDASQKISTETKRGEHLIAKGGGEIRGWHHACARATGKKSGGTVSKAVGQTVDRRRVNTVRKKKSASATMKGGGEKNRAMLNIIKTN